MPVEGSVQRDHVVATPLLQVTEVGHEHANCQEANHRPEQRVHDVVARRPAEVEQARILDVVHDATLHHGGDGERQAVRLEPVQPDVGLVRRPPRGGDVHDLHDAEQEPRGGIHPRPRVAHPHGRDAQHGHAEHGQHVVDHPVVRVPLEYQVVLDLRELLFGIFLRHDRLVHGDVQHLELGRVNILLLIELLAGVQRAQHHLPLGRGPRTNKYFARLAVEREVRHVDRAPAF
mmetsp:Transcript_95960/g.249973  ORF Transcript_95960/g.249973 Transcript_95960/m.249973 type:complete len:232 (+) Transcript_95960:339-1034(+)